MFLKNKNIIFKIRRSKVTDYAALKVEVRKSNNCIPSFPFILLYNNEFFIGM